VPANTCRPAAVIRTRATSIVRPPATMLVPLALKPRNGSNEPRRLRLSLRETQLPSRDIGGIIRHQDADPPHPVGLLRMRHERPRCRRAAESQDELAARFHSITSSARSSRVGGIVRPMAPAVFRFTARHRVDHGTICGRSGANSGHYKPLCAYVDRTFVNPNSSRRRPEKIRSGATWRTRSCRLQPSRKPQSRSPLWKQGRGVAESRTAQCSRAGNGPAYPLRLIGLHEGARRANASQRIRVPRDRHRDTGLHRLHGALIKHNPPA
jgi:hypothetical protein